MALSLEQTGILLFQYQTWSELIEKVLEVEYKVTKKKKIVLDGEHVL